MSSSKPVTPIRRSKSGRPGSANYDIPTTASMELLPPDPSSRALGVAAGELRDSKGRSSQILAASSPSGKRPASTSQSPAGPRPGSGPGQSVDRPRSSQVVLLSSTKPAEQAPVPAMSPMYPTTASADFASRPLSSLAAGGETAGLSPSRPPTSPPVPQASSTPQAPSSPLVTAGHQHHSASSSAATGDSPLLASVTASTTQLAPARLSPGAGASGGYAAEGGPGLSTSMSAINPLTLSTSSIQTTGPHDLTLGAATAAQGTPRAGSSAEQRGGPGAAGSGVASRPLTPPLGSSEEPGPTPARIRAEAAAASAERASGIGASVSASVYASRDSAVGQGSARASGVYGGDMYDPPDTPQSVASGRAGAFTGGGTFFTALHKDFGFGGGGDPDLASSRPEGLSASLASAASLPPPSPLLAVQDSLADAGGSFISRHNPMQSPGSSELGDGEEPEDPEVTEYLAAYEDEGLGKGLVTGLTSEWSNPMMTPRDSTASGLLKPEGLEGAEVTRTSLMSVIQGLYAEDEDGVQLGEEAEAGPAPEEAGEGPEGKAEGEGKQEEVDVRSSMREIDAMLLEQERRRGELGAYITHLQELKDEDGSQLVQLPRNYLAMVETLIRKQRSESAVLQGWLGPRRFEDLPIAQLPDSHSDPKVQEGLGRIKELDGRLADKTMEALIVARETYPDKWAEEEAKRMERHSRRVEEALKKQRMKRLRAGRLSRAVEGLGPEDSVRSGLSSAASSMEGSLAPSSTGSAAQLYARYFQLRPEEEELVEAILARADDAEEEVRNPFDLSAIDEGLEGEEGGQEAAGREGSEVGAEASSSGAGADGQVVAGEGSSTGGPGAEPSTASVVSAVSSKAKKLSLAAINAKLEEYAMEHEWTPDGVLADFSAVAAGAAAGKGPSSEASVAVMGPVPSISGSARPGSPGARSAARSVGSSTTVGGKRDYLREAREAKELQQKESDLDARIRAFKTSDPRVHLTSDQLHVLVEQCQRLEALHQQRCEELREAKERKERERQQRIEQQQQQQQGGKAKAKAKGSPGAPGLRPRVSAPVPGPGGPSSPGPSGKLGSGSGAPLSPSGASSSGEAGAGRVPRASPGEGPSAAQRGSRLSKGSDDGAQAPAARKVSAGPGAPRVRSAGAAAGAVAAGAGPSVSAVPSGLPPVPGAQDSGRVRSAVGRASSLGAAAGETAAAGGGGATGQGSAATRQSQEGQGLRARSAESGEPSKQGLLPPPTPPPPSMPPTAA